MSSRIALLKGCPSVQKIDVVKSGNVVKIKGGTLQKSPMLSLNRRNPTPQNKKKTFISKSPFPPSKNRQIRESGGLKQPNGGSEIEQCHDDTNKYPSDFTSEIPSQWGYKCRKGNGYHKQGFRQRKGTYTMRVRRDDEQGPPIDS